VIEAESETIGTGLAPLAIMGNEMESATAPLQALDAQMEALGRQQEIDMTRIDQEIHSVIDEAVAKGLASPATSSN
jgi:hypothetical protein